MAITFVLSMNAVFSSDLDNNLTADFQDNSIDDNVLTVDNTQNIVSISSDDESIGDNATDSTIKPGKVTNRYYDGVYYSATFYDDAGNPLKDTVVFCGVESIYYGVNATTNSEGVAKFPLPLDKGTYTLYLINENTQDYITDTINVFDVITGNKDIVMYYDGGNTYKVRVYGDDGKPVKANQKVTFVLGSKKYTKKTDSKGYAKLVIDAKPGFYAVTAKYKDFTVANLVYVKQVLKPITKFSGKRLGSTFKYKVKLLGKNIKNKKITVKFNKRTYSAKTNKKGLAIFTLKTPTKTGKYNLVTVYKKTKVTSVFGRYYAWRELISSFF